MDDKNQPQPYTGAPATAGQTPEPTAAQKAAADKPVADRMAADRERLDEGKEGKPKYDLEAINKRRKEELNKPPLTKDWADHVAATAGSQDIDFQLMNSNPPANAKAKDEQRKTA